LFFTTLVTSFYIRNQDPLLTDIRLLQGTPELKLALTTAPRHGVTDQSSVARWLSLKPSKSCHEKLLDPAEYHVTNFQLKSAKNSKIAVFEV